MTEKTKALPQAVSLQGICPNCNAQPGSACSVPTDTGRREVRWFHYGRYENGMAQMTRKKQEDGPGEVLAERSDPHRAGR